LMSRINQVLATNNRHNRFMTLQLLEINGKASTVRWASAGHDPAIVFDPATDAFHALDGGDIPLGIDEKVEYGDFTSPPLAPGSILAIGTDGVWETFNSDNQQYGKDRLRSVIRANHNHTADQ